MPGERFIHPNQPLKTDDMRTYEIFFKFNEVQCPKLLFSSSFFDNANINLYQTFLMNPDRSINKNVFENMLHDEIPNNKIDYK